MSNRQSSILPTLPTLPTWSECLGIILVHKFRYSSGESPISRSTPPMQSWTSWVPARHGATTLDCVSTQPRERHCVSTRRLKGHDSSDFSSVALHLSASEFKWIVSRCFKQFPRHWANKSFCECRPFVCLSGIVRSNDWIALLKISLNIQIGVPP